MIASSDNKVKMYSTEMNYPWKGTTYHTQVGLPTEWAKVHDCDENINGSGEVGQYRVLGLVVCVCVLGLKQVGTLKPITFRGKRSKS